MRGTIKFYDHTRGFGFINAPGVDGDVFFHVNKVTGIVGAKSDLNFEDGEPVEFDWEDRAKGKCATTVRRLVADPQQVGEAMR